MLLCNRWGTQAKIGIVILGERLGLGGDWWSQGTITSLIVATTTNSIFRNRLRLDELEFKPLLIDEL